MAHYKNGNKSEVIKHCGCSYEIVRAYSEETWSEEILYLGKVYEVKTNPRPAKTEAELMCVFVDGIRYASFAKFLKSKKV